MKNTNFIFFLLTFVLISCNNESSKFGGLPVDASADDLNDIQNGFRNGGAVTGEDYFAGVVSEVVSICVKWKEVGRLDDSDEESEKIIVVLDSLKSRIELGRNALDLYKSKDWPKKQEFQDITYSWFDALEALTDDYLYDLAGPMSRSDDTWTEEELILHENFTEAKEHWFANEDKDWVDYQYVYAKANNFTIDGIIDEEEMIDDAFSETVEG